MNEFVQRRGAPTGPDMLVVGIWMMFRDLIRIDEFACDLGDDDDPEGGDIDLGVLLKLLDAKLHLPLVFKYDGRDVKPGYHVTEVKSGRFDALDCGANPESWTEIFVQLWDVDEDGRTHMPAAKFSAIVRKVSEHVGLPKSARLTFEVSDGVAPMALFCASTPSVHEDAVRIELSPRPASCKPPDRWLEEQGRTASSCCGKTSTCCA